MIWWTETVISCKLKLLSRPAGRRTAPRETRFLPIRPMLAWVPESRDPGLCEGVGMSSKKSNSYLVYDGQPDDLWCRVTVRKRTLVIESWLVAPYRMLGRWSFRREHVRNQFSPIWRLIVGDFIKRSIERANLVKASAVECGDAEFVKKFPALADFMTTLLQEGKARKTATLTVMWQDGQFRCFLNDRETLLSMCVVSDTFAGLWKALESSLTSAEPQWRRNEGSGAQRTKKRP